MQLIYKGEHIATIYREDGWLCLRHREYMGEQWITMRGFEAPMRAVDYLCQMLMIDKAQLKWKEEEK